MLNSHWKSPLLCVSFLSPSVRWWMLWSRTPLHVALSCTTSLSRSLPLWRTTSMSAAVKPEPANIFCSQSLPPAANCLSPAYMVTWECRSQELSVLSVIILQANCYQDGKRHSKGFKPACEASYICKVSLLSCGDAKKFSQILIHETDAVPTGLYYALEGMCGSSEMGFFGMSLQLLGPTVRPGGNLNALNPFLKGTSQWCTVL